MVSFRFGVLVALGFSFAPGANAALTRSESLQKAQQMAAKNRLTLSRINDQLSKALSTSQLMSQSIHQLKKQSLEFELRQQFFDRLTFMIESHYKPGASLTQFLSFGVTKMERMEQKSPNPNASFRQFLHSLAATLKSSDELEDPFAFLEGFINYSSLTNPKSSGDYALQQDYTNGKASYRAKTIAKDEVGSLYEKQILRAEANQRKVIRLEAQRNSVTKVPSAAIRMAETAKKLAELPEKQDPDTAFTTAEGETKALEPQLEKRVSLEPQKEATKNYKLLPENNPQ